MKKNNVSKRAITTAGVIALGAGAAFAQGKTDTTKIVMYDPFPVLKEGQPFNFGGRDDSYYEMKPINEVLSDYDQGKTRPDTTVGDIEIDYFRALGNVQGFAEYSMNSKDLIAANSMSGVLNNLDKGQHVGQMTREESFIMYKALRKAGYLQNVGDRVKVLFPRTDEVGFGTINGQKALFPAGNYVRGVMFVNEGYGKEDPCTDCDEDKKLNSAGDKSTRIRNTVTAADTTEKTFSWGPEISMLYLNDMTDMNLVPQAGLFGKYGRFGLGLTGAYRGNTTQDAIVFLNAQGNGSTTDSTYTKSRFGSIGAKASFDIAKAVSLCLHAENNYINQTIDGNIRTKVSDGVNSIDETVKKPTKKNSRSYVTIGPELDFNLGEHVSIITGARFYADKKFSSKAFEGAYGGLRINF